MNHKISRVCLSLSIGCKKDATEYMLIIYLLRVIDENEESIYDFDSGIYMNIRYRRFVKSYSIGCKKDATEYMLIIYLLRVIDENEESIYMILTAVYI